jgi:hypothetical protein
MKSMTAISKPLPCHGQAQFKGHIESRRARLVSIHLNTGQVVDGELTTTDEFDNPV